MKEDFNYNVIQFYLYFFRTNPIIITLNTFLETLLPIIEINLYRILTEEILEDIEKNIENTAKLANIMKDLFNFFGYFLLIVFLKFANKIIVNLIIPQFRISSRKMILENYLKDTSNENQNTSLIITLNAMPMALYNVYKSMLKFILPLIALHFYVCYSIYNLNQPNIFKIVFIFCILNLVSIGTMVFFQSKLSSEIWSLHGTLVEHYNQFYAKTMNDESDTYDMNHDDIYTEEKTFEEKRFDFYKKLNFIIYLHMFVFLIFSFYITSLFYKTNQLIETKKVITLFLFCGKYFSSLLSLSVLTIDSFGRIRILNKALEKNLISVKTKNN